MENPEDSGMLVLFSNWLATAFLALHWMARFYGADDMSPVFLLANVVCLGFSVGFLVRSYLEAKNWKGGE